MEHDFFYLLNFCKGSSIFPVGAFQMEICAKWRRSISILGHFGANFEWTEYTSEDQKWQEIHNVLLTGTVDSHYAIVDSRIQESMLGHHLQ